MPDSLMFAVSNADLPPLSEWQRALDAWKPLLPMEFLRIDAGPEGGCVVRVGNRDVTFTSMARTVGSVVGERHPNLTSRWSFAYGFRGGGGTDGWISGAASAIARAMYASATGGALYRSDLGAFRDFTSGRDRVDAVFAQEFGEWEVYRARYPQESPPVTAGSMAIELRLRK